MHFRWGVTLVGKLSTGLCSPRRGTPFQYPGRRYVVEVAFEKKAEMWLSVNILEICINLFVEQAWKL